MRRESQWSRRRFKTWTDGQRCPPVFPRTKEGIFMSETARLADQIRRAFDGDAWHGDSLVELHNGVDARMAHAHPIKSAHSIWELVLHIAAWDDAVLRRAGGAALELEGEQNFPPVKDTSEAAWRKAIAHAMQTHKQLANTVAAFPDS